MHYICLLEEHLNPIHMRQLYSICFASHDEVMFRDESDYNMFTNLMAVAAFRTKTELLADAIMSTHVHFALMADDSSQFVASLRQSYGRYFNHKYSRKGRLGPKGFYQDVCIGFRHKLQLVCYILRNGLHHGQCATAFGYRHSTIGSVFNRDMGRQQSPIITSRAEIQAWLPRGADFPDTFYMNDQHVLMRESFMEIGTLESSFFSTARNFMYQMNRITDEFWINEQLEDKGKEELVTLFNVEKAFDRKSVEMMLVSEKGTKYNPSIPNDTEVCQIIDRDLISKGKSASIYSLSDAQRQKIAVQLQKEFKIPKYRAYRCLALPLAGK